jgi:hypothetical protein
MSKTQRTLAFSSILVALMVSACAHLPTLTSLSGDAARTAAVQCRQAYPTRPWRATHTLFATMPFGHNGGLLGVTSVEREDLHSILLSPEGIRLFDAIQKPDGTLAIYRAVPPFDGPDFSRSLMRDVASSFLPPQGEPSIVGTRTTGETLCLWSAPQGETTEVELQGSRPAAIRTYLRSRLTREIVLVGTAVDGFFPEVRLRVPGTSGYSLEMRLIDHE